MAHVKHSFATVAVLAAVTVAGMAGQQPAPPAAARDYRPVTPERLRNPDAADWLMVRRTYDGWGYSPLAQITPANVARLEPVWTFATGQENGHEAPPIVNSGVMFVATPGNQVIALDAKTGQLLWRYRRPLPEGVVLLHPTSRGVALSGDKVLFAAGEAVLVALDAKSGSEVWTTKVADNSQGYYMSLAPLVVDGKVMVGASGGEYRRARFRRGVRRRDRHANGGGPTWCRRLANPAARRGPKASSGRPAADRCGSRATTIPKPTWRSGAPATADRGWAINAPATTSTRHPRSRSMSPPAGSRATFNTIRTTRGTGTKSRRRSSSTISATGAPSRA